MEDQENEDLMAMVWEDELLEVMHSFHKDKRLGPDGWPIEFF